MGESVEWVVAAQHAKWGTSTIDADVFGTGDQAEIAAIADRFCRQELGAGTEEALFYGASAGCVLGVRLSDGAEVVIKTYQQRWRAPFLRAVQAVQLHVGRSGLPCATPLRGPTALVPGRPNLAVIETYLADPGMRPFTSAAERCVSAAGLAAQIGACRDLPVPAALADHPLRKPTDDLYPEPHSPLFDFAGTAAGPAARRSCGSRRHRTLGQRRLPQRQRADRGPLAAGTQRCRSSAQTGGAAAQAGAPQGDDRLTHSASRASPASARRSRAACWSGRAIPFTSRECSQRAV